MSTNSSLSTSAQNVTSQSTSAQNVIIYDGNPIKWSPFISRYHIDLTIRGLSYLLNEEEVAAILQEPPPPQYQLAQQDIWPEDMTAREQRVTYNISIGQNYAASHKSWEEKCAKMNGDFEKAMYILLERVSANISAEVVRLITTQQFESNRERYTAVWNLIFKRFGPHNQSEIRKQLTKCDPSSEGWLTVLNKYDAAIATLRNIPYCNSKTGLPITDDDGNVITFEPANDDLLGYLKRHLAKAPPDSPLNKVLRKIISTGNITYQDVANDIRNIFATTNMLDASKVATVAGGGGQIPRSQSSNNSSSGTFSLLGANNSESSSQPKQPPASAGPSGPSVSSSISPSNKEAILSTKAASAPAGVRPSLSGSVATEPVAAETATVAVTPSSSVSVSSSSSAVTSAVSSSAPTAGHTSKSLTSNQAAIDKPSPPVPKGDLVSFLLIPMPARLLREL